MNNFHTGLAPGRIPKRCNTWALHETTDNGVYIYIYHIPLSVMRRIHRPFQLNPTSTLLLRVLEPMALMMEIICTWFLLQPTR